MLSDRERQEIEAELQQYPDKRAGCVEALKVIQRHRGWVSDDSLKSLALLLGMTCEDLDGVATFYNLIFRRPVGRHVDPPMRQHQLLDQGVRSDARTH